MQKVDLIIQIINHVLKRKMALAEWIGDFFRGIIVFMVLFPLSTPIGIVDILVLKFFLETFEPQPLMPVLDLINFFTSPRTSFSPLLSLIMPFLLFIVITFIGAVTLDILGILYIWDNQRWWQSLPEEEKEKIESYWTSIDYQSPGYR